MPDSQQKSTNDGSLDAADPTLGTETALIPIQSDFPTASPDITRSYFLNPSSIRNYDSLTEQLLEDHQRPERTKVHMDVNLSVDLDLTPETFGDLQFSMLYVTVKRKPWEEDVISRDGRRIAGTVLRISDGRGNLVHRQVMGFQSFGEWWWVLRVQLGALLKRRAQELWRDGSNTAKRIGFARVVMILAMPIAAISILLWRLIS